MHYLECNGCGQKNYRLIRPYPGFNGVDLVECRACGLMQAQPLPTDEFLFNYYQNTFGNQADAHFNLTESNEKHLRQRAYLQFRFVEKSCHLTQTDYERGLKILDVGCHAGTLLSYFKQRGGEVLGVDPNPRSRYAEIWYDIQVIQDLFRERLFEAESFDLLLHSHALEHVRNPKGYLAEFYRIVKPGGFVFIEVPNETRDNISSKKVIPHLYFFTPQTLSKVARDVGFEVEGSWLLGCPAMDKKRLFSREGVQWLTLRSRARYSARGKFNPITFFPYYGRYLKGERFFKGYHPDAEMLRVILRKPLERGR